MGLAFAGVVFIVCVFAIDMFWTRYILFLVQFSRVQVDMFEGIWSHRFYVANERRRVLKAMAWSAILRQDFVSGHTATSIVAAFVARLGAAVHCMEE